MSYDYLIFQGKKALGDNLMPMFLGNPGQACSGLQKASQSFAKMFLTDKGSVAGDADAGTEFMTALRDGRIRDESTMQSFFQLATVDILNYQSLYQKTAANDEKITRAELISWDMKTGFLSIQVKITTAAGSSATYTMPVNTGVTQ